jgi:CRP-like cAMP-binding protein
MRLLTEWTGQSLLVGPEQRMAKLLYLMAREQKHPVNPTTLHVTQARLASLARCSRQTANALLSALEARGLISLAYGKFEIVNLAELAVFADAELPE